MPIDHSAWHLAFEARGGLWRIQKIANNTTKILDEHYRFRQNASASNKRSYGGVMNKSELIKALADETNIPFDDASMVVNTFFDAMKQSLLAGERIEIRGFGSFKIKEYEGYAGRNPKTGESVTVSSKRLPFFRAGKELKEFINQ